MKVIDFTPYGHEWAKEMMKFTKLQLIGLLKDSLIENELNDKNLQLLKSEIAKFSQILDISVATRFSKDFIVDKLRQLSQ